MSELLNCINQTHPTLLEYIPLFPLIRDLAAIPSFHEVTVAVKKLKNNKATGPDGIPAEVLKNLLSFIAYSAGALLCPQCAASRHE